RTVHVLGRERDVLDPLAVILAQVFLDLTLVVLRFVDRDADQAAGTGQGAREESRAFALDVEVADLAEVEQSLVEARPYVRGPASGERRGRHRARETPWRRPTGRARAQKPARRTRAPR